MPHKSVLYVITKATWGGAQRYVLDLIEHARERGYEPSLAYGEPGLLAERVKALGIPTYEVKGLARDIDPMHELAAKRELTALMKKLAPDVVHLNSSKAGFTGGLAARAAKISRIVFTAHGWAFNEARPWYQRELFRVLHKATIMNSDVTVCVSEAVKRYMDKGAHRKKLIVVHNGIECGALMSKDAARAALTVPKKNGYWIGMIAELHRTKRVDLAIEAFSRIAHKHPEAELVVLGAGEERGRLEGHIAEKLLNERIHLLGFVKDAAHYLPAFDLYLLPSRTEAFAFVALEAGCAGLPVIASNVGGIPEIIKDGETGILVESGNVQGFADALTALMDDPARARELGDALKARVAHDFTKTKMLNETFATYEPKNS